MTVINGVSLGKPGEKQGRWKPGQSGNRSQQAKRVFPEGSIGRTSPQTASKSSKRSEALARTSISRLSRGDALLSEDGPRTEHQAARLYFTKVELSPHWRPARRRKDRVAKGRT
jgi:hypothetical protein